MVAVARRLVQGTNRALRQLLRRTQRGGVLNTACSERLNGTFCARLSALVRRTRALLRRQPLLHAVMYLVGTVYNFCTLHASLTQDGIRRVEPVETRRTPAMAAGITDHCWSMSELPWHQIPPLPWRLPKRRGRPSKATQRLVAQWAT